jgi:hypothetical protein
VLGPYNHANMTIGRAFSLLSQNLQGGSVPGDTYMGSLGNWLAVAASFPEAEERSPWQPLHVQKGFKPIDSTVTVFFGGWYMHAGHGPRDTWQDKMIRSLTATDYYLPPLLVMDPIAARGFVDRGFDSKEKLAAWCAGHARITARDYWDSQWIRTLVHPHAIAGVEPFATRLKAAPDEMIEIFRPDEINVVVAGGETQGVWKLFGGFYRGHPTFSVDAWR